MDETTTNFDEHKAGSLMVKHFCFISVIAVTVAGLALSYVITMRTQDIMFRSYANVTAANVKQFISKDLKSEDFERPMSGERLAQFNAWTQGLIGDDILKIKLWNRDGTVIFSSDQRYIGLSFPIKEDLRESLRGEADSEIIDTNDAEEIENELDRRDFDKVVETYVPVSIKGSSEIVGSYEIYSGLNAIQTAVTSVKILIFAGLFALYLLLILIIRWASSMLIKQYEKLKQFSNTLHKKAITDELTGLYNRRFFGVRLNEEFVRAIRYERSLSLIFIDIDHFKQVNDRLGHVSGDKVLKEIGDLIKSNLRESDIACRYGGEEFAIIVPETEGQDAMLVAEKLRTAFLNILKEYRDRDMPLTLSFGVADYPASAGKAEELVMAADIALYNSKNNGRNRSSYYRDMSTHGLLVN